MDNFDKQIKLIDVAQAVNMSETAFSRFIKKRTGKNYVDAINDIRLGHATRMLVDTTHRILRSAMFADLIICLILIAFLKRRKIALLVNLGTIIGKPI